MGNSHKSQPSSISKNNDTEGSASTNKLSKSSMINTNSTTVKYNNYYNLSYIVGSIIDNSTYSPWITHPGHGFHTVFSISDLVTVQASFMRFIQICLWYGQKPLVSYQDHTWWM